MFFSIYSVLDRTTSALKGIVQPKMKILSSFTITVFLLWSTKEDISKKHKITLDPIDFHYLLSSSAVETKSFRFGTTFNK